MKNFIITMLVLTSASSYSQQCVEGQLANDLTDLEIQAICNSKEQAYHDAKANYEEVFSQVDMTNIQDQKLWAIVLGPELNYQEEKSQKDWKYCSDCSKEAREFYRCSEYADNYQAAVIHYKKEYLQLNLLNREDQVKWQTIEPALNEKIKSMSAQLRKCKNS